MRVRQCSCPTSATVYGPKAVFQLVQLTVAIVSKRSSRCKTELLPVTSEQSMAMPGGINCNYTIPHLRSFFLCSAAALQSVLPQCPTSITAGDGSSSVPQVLLSSQPFSVCPDALLLCRAEGEPGYGLLGLCFLLSCDPAVEELVW